MKLSYEQLMNLAMLNYEHGGGDVVVECFDEEEMIEAGIRTAKDLKRFCRLQVELANERAYGDTPPKKFKWVTGD